MIRIGVGDRALFASDMHLGAHAPRTAARFIAMLERECALTRPRVTHLFLLGDLFEAWIGDDQTDPVADEVITTIARLAESGVAVFVMRGNRDFLLDAPIPHEGDTLACRIRFSERTGATMIDDPCLIELFGTPTLLAHGDALCTDDGDYQRFRSLTRKVEWQEAFLRRSLEERIAIGRDLRARSELSKAGKAEDLMDVNEGTVRAVLQAFGAARLIHGHTHRPARHELDPGSPNAERWVLPDWDADDNREGFLQATEHGLTPLGTWKSAL